MTNERPRGGESQSGGSESVQPTDHTLFVDAPPTIGNFRLDILLGRGGMGEVWRAHDTNLERDVALKLMRRELNENTEAAKRFMREARAVARLNHPNIVQIYTFGEINGAMYFVMELVEGCTVTQEIRARGRMTPIDAVSIILQAIEGLDYALNRGIIHRDIKPSNLMLRPDGLVKIADFGLAKIRAAESQMTAAGSTMGSPNYMSPEQARGEEADHRSDMYSLGITLYQMLAAELPFTADSPLSVLLKQIQEPLPEPQFLQDMLDGSILNIIKRMTAKHVDRRYPDYREVAADLDAAVPGARRKMANASGLSATSSYPTPDPNAVRNTLGTTSPRDPGQSDQPQTPQSTPPPVPQPQGPTKTVPAVSSGSSVPTYHGGAESAPLPTTTQPATATPVSVPRSATPPWAMIGAGLLLVGALSAYFFLPRNLIQQQTTAQTTPAPTPPPSTPVPTVSPSPSPIATQKSTPSPTTAPSPTPIIIVVQQSPAATPIPAPTTILPAFTPQATPIRRVTTIDRGILAPDMPNGTAIPVRAMPNGSATTLPAQTEVEVVRAVSATDGSSGYVIRVNQAEYFVVATNLRVETSTRIGSTSPVPTANSPTRPTARPGPQVVQLGAPTDTAPSVPIFRDAAGIYELRMLPRGTEVTVSGTERDSFRITLPDGRNGYVLRKSTSPQGTMPVPDSGQ